MSENDPQEDPKIIVDEDWKAQVEKEKEQLKQEPPSDSSGDDPTAGQIPPASFLTLLSMLGAQAMSCLGIMPDPTTGEASVNRPLAKHCIDTLGVLQEKTQGNLNDDEAAHLRDALHQLRMIYVSTANQPDSKPPENAAGNSGPSIELP